MNAGRATQVGAAVDAIRRRTTVAPAIGIIAGSGLSDLSARVADATAIPYDDIPGWPTSTVVGHAGELVLGSLAAQPVAVARGRAHLYEGYSPPQLIFGVRVLAALGARMLIVTNAAGGLNPKFDQGDLMALTDHLFLPGMAGHNPLVGPNDEALGPRFPSMVQAYDPALRALARRAAPAVGLRLHEGVYAMVAGPSFETPAEAALLHRLGADAVGMSTAPETVAARHLGLRVLGLSLITNRVPLLPPEVEIEADGAARGAAERTGDALHAEVTAVGAAAAGKLARLIERVVAQAAA